MDTVLNTHNCPENQESDFQSIELLDYEDAPSPLWFLMAREYADEQDVRMGEAEKEGELIFEFGLPVNFCPFCGVKLGD